MTIRVLFLINGLGLGNSTRCLAIIDELSKLGATIEVVTSGNGTWFLSNRAQISKIHKSEPFHYGAKEGRISILKTFKELGHTLTKFFRNRYSLKKIIEEFCPHIIVPDSEYTFTRAQKGKIPLVAINNSNVVFFSFFRFSQTPRSIWAQFFGVELLDLIFHKIVSDLVISHALDQSLSRSSKKFLQVGPIVRNLYQRKKPLDQNRKRVVIMLSGSIFGTQLRVHRQNYPFEIDVIGCNAPAGWQSRDQITFHGKLLDTFWLLSQADLVVVNGGFSAVSEVFSMKIPMVVVPVPKHSEQWVNGQTIVNLGVGVMADEASLEEVMLLAYEQLDDFRNSYRTLQPTMNGAIQAARKIISLAKASLEIK